MIWLQSGCFTPNPNRAEETAPDTTAAETDTGSTTEPTTDAQEDSGVAPSSSDTGSSADTDPGTSGVGPIDCDNSETSNDCEAPSPYCDGSTCQPCDNLGGDDFCDGRSSGMVCHPSGGSCEACIENDDCGGGSCGDSYNCVACDEHTDCAGTACNLETGECLSTSLVFWIDGTGCGPPGPPDTDPGFGSENQPYCWLTTALDQVESGQSAVFRVSGGPGTQPEVDLSTAPDRTLAFLGLDGWTLGETGSPFSAGNGSTVFLDSVTVRGASVAALTCNNARLWLSNSTIEDSASGIVTDTCSALTVERSQIQQTAGHAIDARGSDVTIVSSMLVRNGETGTDQSALRLEDSTFEVRYSTIVGSLGAVARASLYCLGSGGGLVRNSIVLSPSGPSIDCPVAHVTGTVADVAPNSGRGNTIVSDYNLGWFQDLTAYDAHVTAGSPFEGAATWGDGDPRSDFDSERRLGYAGFPEFAGADQP